MPFFRAGSWRHQRGRLLELLGWHDIGGHPRFPGTREWVAPSAPPTDWLQHVNQPQTEAGVAALRCCVAASIAIGPSAILTGSRTRPSDWGSNARFGPVEDRRNNRR